MKREKPPARRLMIWLVLVSLVGFNSDARLASARQEITPTVEPPIEETKTPSPESQFLTVTETPLQISTGAEIPPASDTPTFVPRVLSLPGDYAPDEILVRFRKSASAAAAGQCLFLAQAEALYSIEGLDVWVARIPSGAVAETLALISSCPQTLYAEPNYVAFAADTLPSDPNFGLQYGLTNIRAPQGWDYSTGAASVTIAVVDSGVDLTHPDLAAKIVPGYDFVNDDSFPQDDHFQSHGTHVAGIAAALSDNGLGVAGVSWGARIMPLKVLDPIGFGFISDVADGIVWAANHGAQVVNLSLGSVSDSLVLQDAVNYASSRGVLLVAASGNSGASPPLYPARYANVIAVGAVDNLDYRLGTSNFGTELDLVAPGWMIYSTVSGGYGYNSGTSMAAPFVSGLAAVLYGIPGNGSAALTTSQMQISAKDLGTPGFDVYYGFGLIQMDAALRLALPSMPRPGGDAFNLPLPRAPTFDLKFTDTPTPTVSPAATATLTPSPSPTISQTLTSTVASSPAAGKAEAHFQSLPAWQLPCAGTAFLLAGLLLLWAAQRKKARKLKIG